VGEIVDQSRGDFAETLGFHAANRMKATKNQLPNKAVDERKTKNGSTYRSVELLRDNHRQRYGQRLADGLTRKIG
jgi:hypothetical protein